MSDNGVDEELWSSFPVETLPRPVVFADLPVRISRGFVDDDSKLAHLNGAIVSEIDLPAGVLTLLTGDRPEAALRSAQPPLRVIDVRRITASFLCDRGLRDLPAFSLQITGMVDRCVVLDPAAEIWWPRTTGWDLAQGCGRAQVDPDDMTVRLTATGGDHTDFLGVAFDECDTYVVASAITREQPYQKGQVTGLVLMRGTVTGRLNARLGGRVLVSKRGLPFVVSASEDPTRSRE